MAVKNNHNHRGLFVLLCIAVFILSAAAGVAIKLNYEPSEAKNFKVDWTDDMGTILTDVPYGKKPANKFDLYLPADKSKKNYKLVVYLHPGGFTTGDKADDKGTLTWLCSKGYVAAGINYTLFGEKNPDANVYTQTMEIKQSMPYVVAKAKAMGYNITEMGIAGGSAGGTLAMVYAYRDAETSPVPVKLMFEAVGPSCFYPEDWACFGFDKHPEAALGLFGTMAGKKLTKDMLGKPAYDEALKPISAALWVNEKSVPSVVCYGAHDKMQAFPASLRLKAALEKNNVPHAFFVCPHSGHGCQNDSKIFMQYMKTVAEYLDKYLPVE